MICHFSFSLSVIGLESKAVMLPEIRDGSISVVSNLVEKDVTGDSADIKNRQKMNIGEW